MLGGITALVGGSLLGGAAGLVLPSSAASAASLSDRAIAPYNGRFYGCMIAADMHGNTFIGKGKAVAQRFLAEATGSIASFNFDLRHDGPPPNNHPNPNEDGYHSDGMGGNVTVSLRQDLGGKPNMAPSGLIAKTKPNNGESTPLVLRPQYATWTFISPGAVKEGTLYHLVFTNSHPTDFVSINAHFYYHPVSGTTPSGHHGPYYRFHWANQYRYRSDPWVNRIRMPFISFNYTNGVHTGVAEDGGFDETVRDVGGSQQARQAFTVTDRSYTFKALWFRAWAAKSGGELIVRLENGAGKALYEKAVPSKSLPTGDRYEITIPWTRIAPLVPLKLQEGKAYNLVFYAKSGSFCINAMRDGTKNGFISRNSWQNSAAEFSLDGGKTWRGWTIPTWDPTFYRRDMRLPAGFELV